MAAGDPQRMTGTVSMDTLVVLENFYPPDQSITTDSLSATLAVPTSKQVHRFSSTAASQSGTAADAETTVAIIRGAGTAVSCEVVVTTTAITGDSTVTVDVHKNGSSMLTGVVTLTSSDAQYAEKAATFSSTTLADGDIVDIIVDATVGTGSLPVGVGIDFRWDEAA